MEFALSLCHDASHYNYSLWLLAGYIIIYYEKKNLKPDSIMIILGSFFPDSDLVSKSRCSVKKLQDY